LTEATGSPDEVQDDRARAESAVAPTAAVVEDANATTVAAETPIVDAPVGPTAMEPTAVEPTAVEPGLYAQAASASEDNFYPRHWPTDARTADQFFKPLSVDEKQV
jgi:hypothetical protein